MHVWCGPFEKPGEIAMSGTVRAPALDAGLGWLNTDRLLKLDGELRGQVVVLDFWTYCCINCMHILPDLAYLEHKYASEPVVFIGVHSAKFANEASRETIRAAILRYEIKHPVVIDDQMKIWRAYAARSWPTVVIIDSRGYVIGQVAGEGNREIVDQTIAQALEQGRAAGTLAKGPLTIRREAGVRAASGLAFPGKVFADPETGWLFVADSNHNRIVIAEMPDAQGRARVIRVVGSGEVGADDGPADRATFNHPQGLCTGHGNLYVCDTENHLIRRIDLETFEVSTIVGTGKMTYDFAGGGMGTGQGINTPWDVVREGSTLYVAMAGQHQIWRIDLPVGFARALAGSGRENIVDGPTETSAFAQSSGICVMGGKLYVADSEVSAIRCIDLATERVSTVIGEGLFSFGDVDGVHPKAKLQHPLGVAAWGMSLVVADTYNHKIKLVDPGARSARTLYGTGKAETESLQGGPAFFEPGGVSVAGDELFVADTNNHRVVRINLKTSAWCEVVFDGLAAPCEKGAGAAKIIRAEPTAVAAGRDVELVLDIRLPSDAHLNPEAPWSVRVTGDGTALAQRTGKSNAFPLTVSVPAAAVRTGCDWSVEAAFAYCTDGDKALCIPCHVAWSVPIRADGKGIRFALSASPEPFD
jgi:thiol-disulfide isomerase/thioredoxin